MWTIFKMRQKHFAPHSDHVRDDPIPKFGSKLQNLTFSFLEVLAVIFDIRIPLMVPNVKAAIDSTNFFNREVRSLIWRDVMIYTRRRLRTWIISDE